MHHKAPTVIFFWAISLSPGTRAATAPDADGYTPDADPSSLEPQFPQTPPSDSNTFLSHFGHVVMVVLLFLAIKKYRTISYGVPRNSRKRKVGLQPAIPLRQSLTQ